MIRLRIKSVDFKEQVKDMEAPSEWTVEDLKREIGRTMHPFPTVENQRLIHAGKLLRDESVLGTFLTLQESPHHVHLALKNGPLSASKNDADSQALAQQYLLQIYNHYYHYVYYYMAYCNAQQRLASSPEPQLNSVPQTPPPQQQPQENRNNNADVEEAVPQERRRDGLELIYMSIQLFIFSCMVYFNSSGTRILFVILIWFLFYLFKRHNEAQRPAAAEQPSTPPENRNNNNNNDEEDDDQSDEDRPLLQEDNATEAPPPPPNPHFLQQTLSLFVSFFASLIPEPQPLHG